MNNFTFYSPTKFVFGKDTEAQAGTLVKEFGGSKVLLHLADSRLKNPGFLVVFVSRLRALVWLLLSLVAFTLTRFPIKFMKELSFVSAKVLILFLL